MPLIPVLCALAGAVFLALGSERQACGVRALEGRTPTGVGMTALLRSPVWLMGGALMTVGIVLNVTALALAPLSVIQPLGAIAVAVTTLLHARTAGLRIDRGTWAAIAACTAGSAAFVLIALAATRHNPVPAPQQERLTVALAWAAVLLAVPAALWLRRHVSALVPILAAGVLYGFVAVAVRLTAVRLLGGRLPDADVIAVVAVAGLLGVWFVQTAYRHGPPDLVIAGLTVIDPMVGVLIGILVLGELRPDVPGPVGLGLVAAALVATVGIVRLARSHPDVLARRQDGRAPAPTSGDTPT